VSATRIPDSVIAAVAGSLSDTRTHRDLDQAFFRAGAPGEPPPLAKYKKVRQWLNHINADPDLDALTILGRVLQEFMDARPPDRREDVRPVLVEARERVRAALAQHGLCYVRGGKIMEGMVGGTLAAPSRSLEQIIRARDLPALAGEFNLAYTNVAVDPPAALTAACAILEAAFRVYIARKGLRLPGDESVLPLWKVVQRDLQLDPANVPDIPLKYVLNGLTTIVQGIAGLRTRARLCPWPGPHALKEKVRTARLAVHVAHSVVTFLIEDPAWPEAAES